MNVDMSTLDRFAESLRFRGKQPATIESYCRDAQRFLDYLGRHRMNPEHVAAETLLGYQDFLREHEGEKDNSVRRTVIGIRQFYRFLTDAHLVPATPFDLVPIPLRDERLPKSLSEDDVETLLTVAVAGRPEFKAMRDAAIVSLLAHEGLKANELIHLRWSDYLRTTDADGIPIATMAVGGNRSRSIFLSRETIAWLDQYRERYGMITHPVIRDATDKRMFIAFKGRDAASPLPEMTRHGLKFILYELGEKAGLKHLNTELLRHFSVAYLIGIGRSPDEIMQHLGLRRMGNIAKHLAKNRVPRASQEPSIKRPIEGATRA